MSATETDGTSSSAADHAGGSHEITDRLIEAAVGVFGENGYEAARVADIAHRAGVTTGAIFARWRSKRHLFLAAIDYTTAYRLTYFENNAEKSAVEKLIALGARLRETSVDKYEHLRIEAFVSGRRDAALGEKVSHSFAVEADNLAIMVAEGKQAGQIDPSLSTEAIVALCLCMELGAHFAAVAEVSSRAEPTIDEWNALINRLLAAMAAPPADDAATGA